jgi:ditrans,polycis-polyprenyl diphosphate synthase
MTIECLSGSDGKESIAKAANLQCSDFCNYDTHGHKKSGNALTEADIVCALRAVGMY